MPTVRASGACDREDEVEQPGPNFWVYRLDTTPVF